MQRPDAQQVVQTGGDCGLRPPALAPQLTARWRFCQDMFEAMELIRFWCFLPYVEFCVFNLNSCGLLGISKIKAQSLGVPVAFGLEQILFRVFHSWYKEAFFILGKVHVSITF